MRVRSEKDGAALSELAEKEKECCVWERATRTNVVDILPDPA